MTHVSRNARELRHGRVTSPLLHSHDRWFSRHALRSQVSYWLVIRGVQTSNHTRFHHYLGGCPVDIFLESCPRHGAGDSERKDLLSRERSDQRVEAVDCVGACKVAGLRRATQSSRG